MLCQSLGMLLLGKVIKTRDVVKQHTRTTNGKTCLGHFQHGRNHGRWGSLSTLTHRLAEFAGCRICVTRTGTYQLTW